MSKEVSEQLIETYERLRQSAQQTREEISPFFSHALALIQTGGMAELIACSAEVFSAEMQAVEVHDRAEITAIVCHKSQRELAQVLSDIALSNINMELAA